MKNKQQKIISSLLILSILIMNCIIVSADNISVYIDGQYKQLTDANGTPVYPFIQSGTTYVPLRGVSEALDCDVIWDGNNKSILIYKEMQSDNSVFRNNSDEIKVYVDNQLSELKDANGTTVKPFIRDGTTYVPLRGISEALGCWVRWNGQTQTVSVYMDTCPPDGVTLSENKPYETHCVDTYYELDGGRLEIDGVFYKNAIAFNTHWVSNSAEALFNLDGRFDSVSMTVGSCDWFEDEKVLTFIVDGNIIDTHTIAPNSGVQNINIELNKGLQLKILLSGRSVGAGNIIFWANK